MKKSIWIGYEPRETNAYAIARYTAKKYLTQPIPVNGICLPEMKKRGLFYREQEQRGGQLWDTISQAPCSTEFSISRFLVKELAGSGWAMFIDCDFMARSNVARAFEGLDDSKAIYCVKHNHVPENNIKMDGQIQTRYDRKNWSSMFIINCDHPANKDLTIELINTVPGRDLHQFCWINDDNLIGELGPEWNYLVGHTDPSVEPVWVHHTEGVPSMPGYEDAEYAEEWWSSLYDWAK